MLSRQPAVRQSLARGPLGSVTAGGSAAGDVIAGGVAGDGRSAAAGILADGQAADESAAGGSVRNQRMFVEGLRGEKQNRGQLLARGTSGSEHDRVGDTVAGGPGKGAAIDKTA